MAYEVAPWMGSVTLTNADQNYSLLTLLEALGALGDDLDPSTADPRVQFIAIQADPDGGAARFWVGNSNMTATNHGVLIYPTQVWPIYSVGADLIKLKQIYLRCDVAAQRMNVVFLKRS
jgi:hypothetical protein